jgi:hypothetical protein
MPILNYTTKINPEKTIGEIQKITIDYNEEGVPCGVTFCLILDEQLRPYILPCNYSGVFQAMKNDRNIPNGFAYEEQAIRTSWRIVKDWVEAQMAVVEANLASVPEVFLPYAITNTGKTLFEYVNSPQGIKLLTQ